VPRGISRAQDLAKSRTLDPGDEQAAPWNHAHQSRESELHGCEIRIDVRVIELQVADDGGVGQ
jgi:hypothetical protein